jgi:hypothetical protein
MSFSGGSYEEVTRWLNNFLTAHAKREDPRVEILLDAGEERQGRSFAARLRLGDRLSPLWELEYKEVADNRESLAWTRGMAEQTRSRARALTRMGAAGPR